MNNRVTFIGSDDAVEVRASEPVLSALERSGLASVPVGCRGGGCGVCKVRVVEGPYHTGRMSRAQVSETEEQQGFALACRLYADGALVLEAVGKGYKRRY